MHETLYAPSKRGSFCFLQSCGIPVIKIPLTFKGTFSGNSSSCCQTISLRNNLGLSVLWEKLWNIIMFQFVGHPLYKYWIWIFLSWTSPNFSPLLSHCGFFPSLWLGYLFFIGFRIFLCIHRFIVILEFSLEEVSSHPLTLPSYLHFPPLFKKSDSYLYLCYNLW